MTPVPDSAEDTDPGYHTGRARLSLARQGRPPVDRDTHELAVEVGELRTAVLHMVDSMEASNRRNDSKFADMRRAIAKGSTRWPSPREVGALMTAILMAFGTWWTAVHADPAPHTERPALVIPKDEP